MGATNQQSPTPLTADEIRGIAPRELILHVIRGVKYAEAFSISVMLDVPQDDPVLSLRTGYEFIADPNTFEDVCKFVREHRDKSVSGRCPASDKAHFEKARQRVLADPSYRGESYRCGSIQLIDFVVPIYEPLSRTFIGVVFGCQRRPVEDEQQVEARLSKYLAKNCPQLSEDMEQLCSLYQRVPRATRNDIDEMMEVCRGIAESLQQRFRFYVETRHREAQRLEEERAVAEINRALVEAQDIGQFWLAMPRILDRMAEWVPFDWAFILRWHGEGASPKFRVCVRVGRGLPSADRVNEVFRDVLLPPLEEHDCGEHIPELFHEEIAALVEGRPASWVFPIRVGHDVAGFLAFGSAPEHRNASCDEEEVVARLGRIGATVATITMEYSELAALEKLSNSNRELKREYRDKLDLVSHLRTTLLSLTHQLNRPLDMVIGALSNVRDLYLPSNSTPYRRHVELGIKATEHSSILCCGLASIFAARRGGRLAGSWESIDVSEELRELAESMQATRGQYDIRFRYFEDSPQIRMNKLSFLFVFYTLIDNALKYADPGSYVTFMCAMEDTCARYALKVKSIGMPIPPGDVEHVFDEFWRSDSAKRRDETGLGVGCWAAREHMERCGGHLYLEVDGDVSVFIVVPPPEE